MKKLYFAALALIVAGGFSGCSNNDDNHDPKRNVILTVMLEDVAPVNRTVETAAVTGPLAINHATSQVFIINANGDVSQSVQLTSAATSGGQVLGAVPLDSKVYIVANIPSSEYSRISALQTLAAIKIATSSISLLQGVVPVAVNRNATEATIVANPDGVTAIAEVDLVPAVSRLEIAAIQGGSDTRGEITSFNVAGIYIDNFFENFTYGAGGTSLKTLVDVDTELATWPMRDDAGWASDPTTVQAAPANGDVWAYNVAAGNTPLIIVKLNNIRWIPTGQSETALTGDYYLTVTGYDNISTFVAGQVYRVGMINTGTGDSDFLFTPDNLGTEPNEEEVELTLNVTNVGWTLNTNRPVFGK